MADTLTRNIGKYRQPLMGIGILSVLAVHLNIMGFFPLPCKALLEDSSMFVYVEGFFFLSGFGIYHSYENSSNIGFFYLKRIKRLYVPYVILMIPYIAITGYIDKETIGLIFSRLLGISFWYEGNYCGMWFIHVLLFLYLVYPLLHKFLFVGQKYFYIKVLLLVITYIIVLLDIKMLYPSYYSMNSFALYRMPFFFFGACIAYENKKNNDVSWLLLWVLSYIVISIANYSNIENLRQIFLMSFFLPLWGYAINILHKNSIDGIYKILNWFGKYTLEIYILHMMLMWVGLRLGYNIRISIVAGEFLAVLLCQPVNKIIAAQFVKEKNNNK